MIKLVPPHNDSNGHETTENPSGLTFYGNNPDFDAASGVPTCTDPTKKQVRYTYRRFRTVETCSPRPKVGTLVIHRSWADDEHPPGVIVALCSFNNGGYGPPRRAYYTVRWNNKLYDTDDNNLRVECVPDMAASDIVGGQTSGLKSDAFHARKAEVANVHKELQEQLDHRVAARANHCEISQVNFMDKLRHEDQSMCAK